MTTMAIMALVKHAVTEAGQLRLEDEGGDNEEAEQGRTPLPSTATSDMPEVPAEDSEKTDPGIERDSVEDELAEAKDTLESVLDNPKMKASLTNREVDQIEAAVLFLTEGWIGKAVKAPTDLPISVKAIIKDKRGRVLCLKDDSGPEKWWDLPGGHINDGESLEEGLRREVREETSLNMTKAKQLGVEMMTLGNETKPVFFFDVKADGDIKCSEEHCGYQWSDNEDLETLNLGKFKGILLSLGVLVPTAQERSDSSQGIEMPDDHRGGDGTQFYRNQAPDEEEVEKEGEESGIVNPRISASKQIMRPGIGRDVLETEPDVEETRDRETTHKQFGPPDGPPDKPEKYRVDPVKGTMTDPEPTNKQLIDAFHMGLWKEGIGDAGDTMVSSDSFTPTGGGGKRRKKDASSFIMKGMKLSNYSQNPGKYHLVKGDSEIILKTMPDQTVDCVVTSPSYWGPDLEGLAKMDLGAETAVDEYIGKLSRVFKETFRVLKQGGSMWLVLGNGGHSTDFDVPMLVSSTLVKSGWNLAGMYGWEKGNPEVDRIFHLTKGTEYYKGDAGPVPSVMRFGHPEQIEGSRFKQFPVLLSEIGIAQSCPPNGVVLDPFVGAGTTILAAQKMGRYGIGIDIDGGEIALAHRRLQAPATIKVKKAMPSPDLYNLKILNKAEGESGPFIIAGYASPVLIDQEGHKISHEALVKDLPRFMAEDGKYANVNIMHSNVTIGKILPSYHGLETKVDERGLFVIAEIRTDKSAPEIVRKVIEDIEAGKLKSFSISGNASQPTFKCDGESCFYDIGDLELYEITICEEGVNQEAKFEVISKAVTGAELKKLVPEADLLKYFNSFKALFTMYHRTGTLEVCLYDPATGEILQMDDPVDII